MIGLTIGCGDEHKFFAEEAAKRLTKYTGLSTHVLGDDTLKEFYHHPVMQLADKEESKCFYLKLFLFDIFPDQEEILYFDCDYCVLRSFNPYKFTPALNVVRDRTSIIQPHVPHLATVINYFNAGFFVANHEAHAEYFKIARQQAKNYRLQWNDQCIWNQMAVGHRIKLNYLPRLYNCLDTGPALLQSNPFAIHSSANYPHYRAGTQIETSDVLDWDLVAMKYQSGLNVVHSKDDRPHSLFLLADGTDSNGNIWFISNESHYMCDIRGDNLKKVTFHKPSYE